MIYQLFSVIAPVLVCAVIGYVWKRQGRPYDTSLVTSLVTNIGTPCLVFFTLIDTRIEVDAFLEMGAATFVTMVVFYAIYFLFLKGMKLSQKAFLSALAYGNVGNMGLPLCLLAFGETGLALAIAYFTVNVILLFTIGVAVRRGRPRPANCCVCRSSTERWRRWSSCWAAGPCRTSSSTRRASWVG